jgi:hypothetical protein
VLREGLDIKVIKDLLKEKADSLTQKAIAANTKKVSLQGQSEVAYTRARKAEITWAALDRPDEIIIEMIEEKVGSLQREAESLEAESKIAETEARQFFAQASATQGTANRYQAATAAPHWQNHEPPQEDRRPHPYHRGQSHGGKCSKGWNRRQFWVRNSRCRRQGRKRKKEANLRNWGGGVNYAMPTSICCSKTLVTH